MNRFLLLIVSLIVIGITALLSIPGSPLLIGGMTQADISALYPTPITPAWFTFSIWSLIYLFWVWAGIYTAFFQKGKQKVSLKVILWFSFTMIQTALWLIPWWFQWMWVALIALLILLGTMWYTYSLSKNEPKIIQWSIELTMGWIHIATFANLAVWLTYIGAIKHGATEIYWGMAILTIAFVATLIFELRFRAHIVSFVFLWASFGIFYGQSYTDQTLLLCFYAVIIFIAYLSSLLRK